MDKINHILLAVNIQDWNVRPLWGRRFVAMSVATNLGLHRSPTSKKYNLEKMEADIQKGLAELKELMK